MRPLVLAALLACVSGAPLRAGSTGAPPALDALIRELLDLSGTRRMLDQVLQQVQTSTARDAHRLPAALVGRLRAALAESYAGEALARDVTDHLRRNATRDRLAASLALLRQPLALRFTELEIQAGTPEAQPELQGFVDKLPYSPPTHEREALLEKLDALTGTSDLMTEVAVSTASAVARGIAGARGPLTAPERERLVEAIDEMRQQVRPAMREQVRSGLLFTYRSATDTDLELYVKLFETDAGQWLAHASGAAVRSALERAALDLGRKLARDGGGR
jgi:hypothetical protein